MRCIRGFLLFLCLVGFGGAFAEEVTVTLQNGLNSYTGCDDAYIGDWMATKTTGTLCTLHLEFEECAG